MDVFLLDKLHDIPDHFKCPTNKIVLSYSYVLKNEGKFPALFVWHVVSEILLNILVKRHISFIVTFLFVYS